ncbi:MAG: hypothetical protein WC823_05795 [Parcubacteria group bacterium]|jgi:hypothetical protein
MSKKKKPRANRKNLIEFEIENAAEDNVIFKSDAMKESVEGIKDAEVEKVAVIEESAAVNESVETIADEKEVTEEKPKKERNRKIDSYIEFLLIFILGVLIGVAFKTEAVKRITIGFNDYQMKTVRQDFDINKIQFEVSKKAAEEAKAMPADNEVAPDGASSSANGE